MRFYEINFLISPDLSHEELNFFQEKVVSFIQEEKGILFEQEKSTKKILAYPNTAYLITIKFQLNPGNLENLKKRMQAEGQILRFLILTKKLQKRVRVSIKTPRLVKPKPKVELEEIEKKLEEILGE